jgi:hypothetical protein
MTISGRTVGIPVCSIKFSVFYNPLRTKLSNSITIGFISMRKLDGKFAGNFFAATVR